MVLLESIQWIHLSIFRVNLKQDGHYKYVTIAITNQLKHS